MCGKAEIQYRDKFRKPRLNGVDAQAHRVVFGVGNFRRVIRGYSKQIQGPIKVQG
jgi:hypothetical protein